MKKVIGKNQVIITSLAILIAVAGYLNFADVDLGFRDKEASTDSSSILEDAGYDLNLKLNYTFILHDHIKLQLNAGVQNIFNSFQKDLDKGEFRDSGYFYGPTQPRTYFIGVKITN